MGRLQPGNECWDPRSTGLPTVAFLAVVSLRAQVFVAPPRALTAPHHQVAAVCCRAVGAHALHGAAACCRDRERMLLCCAHEADFAAPTSALQPMLGQQKQAQLKA